MSENLVDFGFSQLGSFSKNQLVKLEEKLLRQEKRLKVKKRESQKHKQMCDLHKECLSMWKTEVENRERKQVQKLMTTAPHRTDNAAAEQPNTHIPPPYTLSVSSLYPDITAMKLDADLDSCPSVPPPPVQGGEGGQDPEPDSTTISTIIFKHFWGIWFVSPNADQLK